MFKERLIKAIEERGVSRYKIAKETKITEATLSNYCNGKVSPSPSIVMQLATYLDVDYEWLLKGSSNEHMSNTRVAEPKEKYAILGKTKLNSKELASILSFLEKEIEEKNKLINKLTKIIEEKIEKLVSKAG